MKNFIKRTIDRIRRKPLLVKPVVSSSNLIIVPEEWLKSLLNNAEDFENAVKNWQYGNINNDKILIKAMCLMGYSKSSKSIIESNERAG